MRRFWGRGAIVAGLLLGVVTAGSYAAGAHLGIPRSTVAASSISQSQPVTTAPNSGQGDSEQERGSSTLPPAGAGHGPRGPRIPRS